MEYYIYTDIYFTNWNY